MKAQLRAIVKADNARRNARMQAELIELAERYYGREDTLAPEGVDPYLYSRSIRGVPSNKARNTKHSESSWNKTLKHRLSAEESTITIYHADGRITEQVPATLLRGKKSAAKAHADDRAARKLALLQSVGNASELASGDC